MTSSAIAKITLVNKIQDFLLIKSNSNVSQSFPHLANFLVNFIAAIAEMHPPSIFTKSRRKLKGLALFNKEVEFSNKI